MLKYYLLSVDYWIHYRLNDDWSSLAVSCLEHFSHDVNILSVIPSFSGSRLSDVDKIHAFQHLADCCGQLCSRHGPLLPDCYSALLVELYRLLITRDKEALLRAMQLSIILLPRSTSTHLCILLQYMHCAASPEQVSLAAKVSFISLS